MPTIADELTFVDTNVLVYAFDDSDPRKRSRASEVIESAGSGKVILSTQVLQEFFVIVTRKLARPVPVDEAEKAVRQFTHLPVVQIDPAIILSAIGATRRHKIPFWDSLIVEAALAAGCTRLLTEDLRTGARYDDLRVENPFAI